MGSQILWNTGGNILWNTGDPTTVPASTDKNVIFMVDNMLDRAAALTASSALASLPVSNLQDQQRTNLWRTNGNTGQASIDITLAAGESGVSGIALVDHNLSLAGSIQIQAWTDAFDGADLVVNETIQPYLPIYGYGEQLYGEGLYGGYAEFGSLGSYSSRSFLRVVSFLQLAASVDADYWRITLVDSIPDYIQCGRVFIGEGWQPLTNYSWGGKLSRLSQSNIRESRGGQSYSNPRPGRMVMEFDLDWLQVNDQPRLWANYLYVETDTPIIIIQRPDADSFDRELRSLYCTFDALSVESAFDGNHKSPIKLIEAL